MTKVKRDDGPFQLLIVVRSHSSTIHGTSVAVHSTIASFPTKPQADIAFANVAEKCNAGGEYTVIKLYV